MFFKNSVFTFTDGFVHDAFLKEEYFLNGYLHTKISPGDHDTVKTCDNFILIVNGFVIFFLPMR